MDAKKIIIPVSPYKQPCDGGLSAFHGEREIVGYLPGTSVRVWYTHLDECFGQHWHNAMEVVVGENGYYQMEIAGTSYQIRKGEIMLIPPGVTHTMQPLDCCTGFVYLFDLSILQSVKSAASVIPIMTKPIYIGKKHNPKLQVIASALLRQMRDEYFGHNEMRELMFYSYFLTLVAEIGKYNALTTQESMHARFDKRQEHMDKFNEIINFINMNYASDLNIDIVSKMFGFSKFHFTRLFKQYAQYTFGDYLTLQRIRAAERLLSHPSMSVTEIAFQSGFSSISTFSRVFRQFKNCTPSEYREIYIRKH